MADERADEERADGASDAPAGSDGDSGADDDEEDEDGGWFEKVVDAVLALADLV